MYRVSDRDVETIKSWITKEPYLPDGFEDLVIRKFLFSCEGSLERTKRCVEQFCSRRAAMPELYCDRDPLSAPMQNVFAFTNVTTYIADTNEMLIYQLTSVPDHFDFYELLKAFTMQCDHWLRRRVDPPPLHHVVVLDLKHLTLKLVAKCNFFYYQKFLVYLLESMPVRLKQVHVINCPSFCDYLYNLIKPALPDYICNLVFFHADHTGLHKYIDKKYLPKDYEGECANIAEESAHWVTDICKNRKLYLDDNCWKADLTKKLKNSSAVEELMSGSFRSLAVD